MDEDVSLVDDHRVMHNGGTVTYRVTVARELGDHVGRWIGWVGDGREFDGMRFGEPRWWACWREDGDSAARWGTGLEFASCWDARDALLAARSASAAR